MLTFALADVVRPVDVIPPWIARTKADVLRWAKAHDAVDAIEASVSCYAGTDRGACDACATRAAAFAEVGWCEPVRLPLVMHAKGIRRALDEGLPRHTWNATSRRIDGRL